MRLFNRADWMTIVIACCIFLSSFGAHSQRTYSCASDADCHMGTCSDDSVCVCIPGYVNGPLAPCQFKPHRKSYTGAAVAEGLTGWIFPTGWAMTGHWPIVGLRLGIEVVTGAFAGGLIASRRADRREQSVPDLSLNGPGGAAHPMNAKWSPGSIVLGFFAGLFSVFHGVSWIGSTIFLSEMQRPDPKLKKYLHKNLGEADLVVMASYVAQSMSISYEYFDADSCALQEGCIDQAGWRRLLRFSSYIYNTGKGDYYPGFEDITPVWSGCHNHYHAPEATTYFLRQELTNTTGTVSAVMRAGHKQGYCFRDTVRISGDYDSKFGCGLPKLTKHLTQGITSGWADIYSKELDCQWVDITDIEPGSYRLVLTVNPNGVYYQDNPDNNVIVVQVEVPAFDEALEKTTSRGVTSTILKEYDQDFPSDMTVLNRMPKKALATN